jgi:capsule polysaccharide export protein KpsE/RkpR
MKELLIENLGVVIAGLATGFGGWFYGRKKADAEAESSQIENAEKLLIFYKNMVDDLGQRLENSILRFNAAENTIRQLEDRVNELTEELKKYKQLNGKIH